MTYSAWSPFWSWRKQGCIERPWFKALSLLSKGGDYVELGQLSACCGVKLATHVWQRAATHLGGVQRFRTIPSISKGNQVNLLPGAWQASGRKPDRKTDRHISARTDRQADRRMDRQREKQTDILAKRRGLASFALGSVAKWRTLTQIIVILDILILAYSGPAVKGALSPVKDIMIFKMMSMSPRSVGLHSAFKEP